MTRTEIARMYLVMARDGVVNAERTLTARVELAREYGLTDADISEVLRGSGHGEQTTSVRSSAS